MSPNSSTNHSLDVMQLALGMRTHYLTAAGCALFVGVHIADGLWKGQLFRASSMYFWAYDVFAWLVLPVVVLVVLRRTVGISAHDYGLSADLGWKNVALVPPLPLVVLFVVYAVTSTFAQALVATWKSDFSVLEALRELRSFWIVGTAYMSATAGLWESIFYIGLPWLLFSRSLTASARARGAFVVISAVLFAADHFEGGSSGVIAAFFFQVVAVSWFFKSRTLWPIIGAHTLVDVYYLWPWPSAQA